MLKIKKRSGLVTPPGGAANPQFPTRSPNPPFEYPVVHCNIDKTLKGKVSGFSQAKLKILDIWNHWTKINQEKQRAFTKEEF